MTTVRDWAQTRACVMSVDAFGLAAADALIQKGADVTIVDCDFRAGEQARLLTSFGARIVNQMPDGNQFDLVIISSPHDKTQESDSVTVLTEVELAYELAGTIPWIALTGSEAEATALLVRECAQAADIRISVAGPEARALSYAAVEEPRPDYICAVLNETQVSEQVSPLIAGVIGPDALSTAGVYQHTRAVCLYDADHDQGEFLVREADVVPGARAIGFSRGIPGISMIGVVDDILVDRAFIDERAHSALEIVEITSTITMSSSLLAATAIARALSVPSAIIKSVLLEGTPDYVL